MDRLARLVEELEARPRDAERVAALRRWLSTVDRATAEAAGPWLVAGAMPRRPARVPMAALREAATAWLGERGLPGWEVDAGLEAAEDVADGVAWLMEGLAGQGTAPADVAGPPASAWLPEWTVAMAAAGADPGSQDPDDPTARRARVTIDRVARLPDAFARRWALRAAAGLARPLATPWQWTRALAAARGLDVAALAWRLHRASGPRGVALWPDEDLAVPAEAADWPWPSPWRLQREAAEVEAEAADADEASPEDTVAPGEVGDWLAEPRWPGWRLQVVTSGDATAVWHVEGELLDPRLPAEVRGLVARLARTLAAGADAPAARRAVEAVLLAWDRARGRAIPRGAVERAGLLGAGASTGGRRAATSRDAIEVSWHLALVGRGLDDPLRAVLPPWPAPGAEPPGPPDLFVTASRPARAEDLVPVDRAPLTRHGARGLVLHGPGAHPPSRIVRPPPRRLLAVLQYLPADWWRGGASPDPRALAAGEAGVALWSRRRAAAAGETVDTGPDAAPVLLPLARLPLASLPADVLAALHAAARERSAQRFGSLALLDAPWTVVELAFDAVSPSRRHRVGAVLAGARLLAWRADLAPGQAHAVDDLLDPAD